jgi:hypothetical protein
MANNNSPEVDRAFQVLENSNTPMVQAACHLLPFPNIIHEPGKPHLRNRITFWSLLHEIHPQST